jgi:hypothetical protein
MDSSLFVADTIELLQNGKVFVLGLYADRVVRLTTPPETPPPSPERPYAFNLALLLAVSGLTQPEIEVEIEIRKPSGEKIIGLTPPRRKYPTQGQGSLNLIMSYTPFAVTELGTYWLQGSVDDQPIRHSFEFKRQISPTTGVDAPVAQEAS